MIACTLLNMSLYEYQERDNNPYYTNNVDADMPSQTLILLMVVGGFANTHSFLVRYQFTEYFVMQGQ